MVKQLGGRGFETRLVQTGVACVGPEVMREGGSSLNKECPAAEKETE